MSREKIITIDNTNQLEAISYSIAKLEQDGEKIIELAFIPNMERVYKTSNNKEVLYPPSSIRLLLDNESLLIICSSLVSSISISFASETIPQFGDEFSSDGYYVKIRKVHEINSKGKIIFDIFEEDTGKQIISFALSKTKAILLLFSLKEAFERTYEKFCFGVASGNYLFQIKKEQNNTMSLNGVWLRNNEAEILKYISSMLIFDYQAPQKLKNYKKAHRQVLIYINNQNNLSCSIKKMVREKNNLHFVFNSQIIAALYLIS